MVQVLPPHQSPGLWLTPETRYKSADDPRQDRLPLRSGSLVTIRGDVPTSCIDAVFAAVSMLSIKLDPGWQAHYRLRSGKVVGHAAFMLLGGTQERISITCHVNRMPTNRHGPRQTFACYNRPSSLKTYNVQHEPIRDQTSSMASD